MKKLKLKALSLGAREILNREQLKRIAGAGSCESALDCPMDYSCVGGDCQYMLPPNGSDASTVSGTGCDSGKIKCECPNNYNHICVDTTEECVAYSMAC